MQIFRFPQIAVGTGLRTVRAVHGASPHQPRANPLRVGQFPKAPLRKGSCRGATEGSLLRGDRSLSGVPAMSGRKPGRTCERSFAVSMAERPLSLPFGQPAPLTQGSHRGAFLPALAWAHSLVPAAPFRHRLRRCHLPLKRGGFFLSEGLSAFSHWSAKTCQPAPRGRTHRFAPTASVVKTL